MKAILVCLLASLAVAYCGQSLPFKTCASGTPVTVSSISADPYPPQKGSVETIVASGSLTEDVTGGKYSLTVTYLGIPVDTLNGDLCQFDPKLPCPIKAGTLTLSKSVSLPSFAPAGDYHIEVSATDQNGKTLFCIDTDINLPSILDEEYLSRPAVTQALVDQVNSRARTWVAGHNSRFVGMTLKQAKGLMGARKGGFKLPRRKVDAHALSNVHLPSTFDARAEWGSKCPTVNEVRDQGSCGSCWAIAAAAAMSDRICVASKGAHSYHLATEDLVSCCDSCGDGCNGGYPSAAWDYFLQTGLVTGGPFNSSQGCYPYEIPACDHHVSGHLKPCGDILPTPPCAAKCFNGADWNKDKHFGASSYSLTDVVSVQNDILNHGPVEAAFTVYEDFLAYKSGVYSHTTGQALGGHAVKILGWGVENGQPYWLVANSWNEDWGNKGYFKILRGSNECGIEDEIVAGLPQV